MVEWKAVQAVHFTLVVLQPSRIAILSFVETGRSYLMVDTCYEPTRDFCDTIMKKMGVETTYYEPTIGKVSKTYQAKYQGTVYRVSGFSDHGSPRRSNPCSYCSRT
ncbi:hypothetical protein [Vibrio splendidus]|uniref:hypothetical protein n=1 Tax=Vibrio splendidus TaxID=29497 RepID=UPI0039A47221